MEKNKILNRLLKADAIYEERLSAWKERCWVEHYEINGHARNRWWKHFGTTKPITLDEFKKRARKDLKKIRAKACRFAEVGYLMRGHPTDGDDGPKVRYSAVPDHFKRMVEASDQDIIYVNSHDIANLCDYEKDCQCHGPYIQYVKRFGWL